MFRHTDLDILVVLYIDDLLAAALTVAIINDVRDRLKRAFDFKELGEVKRFLGFDILCNKDDRKIFISQESYTRALLAKRDL